MDRVDRERLQHIRRWAMFMIMHLEGRDSMPPRWTAEEALERLRELIDRELRGLALAEGQTAARDGRGG